ncbi:MAG: peptidylprolyl isomerase [Planctomycetota bacterium]|nr:peptidylprolyl isomerase [Planctomycetota bacterium]
MKTTSIHSKPRSFLWPEISCSGTQAILSLLLSACLSLTIGGCGDDEPAQPIRQTATDDGGGAPSVPESRPPDPRDEPEPVTGSDRYVRMSTTQGEIIVRLFNLRAPISVQNFLGYVDSKFYDGTVFHRVIKDYMIQGGGLDKDMTNKPTGGTIRNEWTNGLKNKRGRVAMARLNGQPDSATSQFFINVADNLSLDVQQSDGAAYAVFGEVVHGMSVVDAIRSARTAPQSDAAGNVHENVPVEPIIINSIKRITAEEGDAQRISVHRRTLDAAASVLKSKGVDIEKAVVTDSGLWYIDITAGTGTSPSRGTRIEVRYNGWLTDGTPFDSSDRRRGPARFRLTSPSIEGWIEGLISMKEGGKRWLIIPPKLGYGNVMRGGVPENSILIFEVELVEIL